MKVCNDVETLESNLADLPGPPPLIIAVEGASGSGKSELGEKLARGSRAHVVSTDRYYNEGVLGDRYQDGLRLDELKEDLIPLRTESERLVVEGICLRDTLGLIGLKPDAYVYCRRISPAGVWNDDPELEDFPDPNSRSSQGRIDWWSNQYHLRTHPHQIADFLFEWREDSA